MTLPNVRDNPRPSPTRWLACRLVLFGALLVAATAAPAFAAADQIDRDAAPAETPAAPPATATAPASLPASQPATRPATQPAPASQPRDPDLTAEMIDSYKKQVQAAQDMLDAQRDNILKMYDKALDQLKLADHWQSQGLKADEVAKQVPDQLEKANAKIQLPVEDLSPHVPEGASLQQIEQLCKEAEELDRAARLEAGSLVREQKSCQDRAQEIQNRHSAIRQTLAALAEQMNGLQAASSAADQAQRVLLRTQRRALWREYNALDKQRASDDARQGLLTVQIELAGRYHAATSKAFADWQDILKQRRAAETAKIAAQASQQSLTFKDRPELFTIAEQNKDLTNRRVELQNLTDQIQRTLDTREAISDRRRSLADNSQSMMKRIETAGLTEAVSSSLRRHRAQLPDVLQHERNVRRLEAEIARAQIDLIDIDDQRAALATPAGIDRQIEQILKDAKKQIAPDDRAALQAQIRELLRTKRTYLGDLIRDYNASIKTWFELLEEERLLIAETRGYANYIDEHILWVRSTRPLQPAHVRAVWHAAGWLVDPDNWTDTGKALLADFRTNPLTVLSGLLLFVWLLAIRLRLRLRLRQIDEIASGGYTYTFSHTLQALGLTLLLAIPPAGLLWFAGWRLSWTVSAGDFTSALAAGLRAAGGLYLALELLRQICRKRGLGETHFHWPAPATKLARDNLAWLIPVALPLAFVHTTIDSQTNADYRDCLGRLAFLAGMVALAVFTRRVLRPNGPLMADFLQRRRDGWLDRLRYLWYPLAIAGPAVLAVAAAFGYYYTAMQLATRVLATIGLVLGALVAKGLLLRLLFVARRKLALEAIEKRKAARAQALANEQPVPGLNGSPLQVDAETSAPVAPAEPEIDLAAVDVQTRRLVRAAVLLGLMLGLYVTWVDMLPALGILDRVHLWSTTVAVSQTIVKPDGTPSLETIQKIVPITLASVAWAGLIVLIAVAAARNIPGLLEITVLRLMPLEPGGRYAINAISRYIITILGLILAFGAIGIGWSKVQWLAAAVTVGLGFGLQEIFANFVSGLIILFERPVRVGDVISLGDISGTVSKIRIRATTIVDWNRKELIVPNKLFITGQTVNWTLSDSILRLVISVGVPYGSDPDLVRSVLLRVARGNPHILETPRPSAFLLSVTNTSLDFSLRVFVPSPDTILAVQDELHTAIDAALREAGIEVAFSRSPG